jgi:hypothetical protein
MRRQGVGPAEPQPVDTVPVTGMTGLSQSRLIASAATMPPRPPRWSPIPLRLGGGRARPRPSGRLLRDARGFPGLVSGRSGAERRAWVPSAPGSGGLVGSGQTTLPFVDLQQPAVAVGIVCLGYFESAFSDVPEETLTALVLDQPCGPE